MIKISPVAVAVAFFLYGSTVSLANAKGGGKSSGGSKSSSSASKSSDHEEASSVPKVSVKLNSSAGSSSTSSTIAGATVGAAVGNAAASIGRSSETKLDPEEEKKKRELQAAQLQKSQEADEARKADAARLAETNRRLAALAADEERQRAEEQAKRQAIIDRAKETKRLALAREASCAIKPVMSNAEIEHCRVIRSLPPP